MYSYETRYVRTAVVRVRTYRSPTVFETKFKTYTSEQSTSLALYGLRPALGKHRKEKRKLLSQERSRVYISRVGESLSRRVNRSRR